MIKDIQALTWATAKRVSGHDIIQLYASLLGSVRQWLNIVTKKWVPESEKVKYKKVKK